MGAELVIAAVSAAVGVAGVVNSISSAADAKKQQKKAQAAQRASQAAQAAQERRQQIREERIKRARILQSAENTGTAGSSGEAGALSGLSTQLGSNLGFNQEQLNLGGQITRANQKASDAAFESEVYGKVGNMALNWSGDLFNAGGGIGGVKSLFESPSAVSDFSIPQRSSD